MTETSPKDTTKAAFIKYFSAKTQIITGLLLIGHMVVDTVRLAASQFSKINKPVFF